MPLLLLRYLPHLIAVAAIAFGLWQVRQAGYRAAEAEQLRQHVRALASELEAAAARSEASNKVEASYVAKIERVEVPIERVRRVLVAGVCPRADTAIMSEGDAIVPVDGTATSDADAELVERIARDSEACIRNAQQLTALQELIRVNTQE